MVHLINGVYCKKRHYDAALAASKAASHLVRRLLTGVFKEDAILKCTRTGQSARAQGKDRQREEMSSLSPAARQAIIGN